MAEPGRSSAVSTTAKTRRPSSRPSPARATIEEAKRKALDQLRKVVPYVNEADVDFVVMEEGSKGGLFGRGKSAAQVEARLRPSRRARRTATCRRAPRCSGTSCRPSSS